MFVATGNITITGLLPNDYSSLVRGVAKQHGLEATEIDRIPEGLRVSLASTSSIGGSSERFTIACATAFTELQKFFDPTGIKSGAVPTGSPLPTPQHQPLSYDPEKQPWFPPTNFDSQELPTENQEHARSLIELVLLTATPVELNATLAKLKPLDGQKKILRVHAPHATYYAGKFGAFHVAVVMCAMGSGGRDGSLLTARHAIDTWHPKAIIMLGIAFGMDPSKQQIGNVIVSEKVTSYEPQRRGKTTVLRGQSILAGKTLLARFRALTNWEFLNPDKTKAKLKIGELLSGEKLVDDPDFKKELLQLAPEALGGEMEGAGLFAAAEDARVEWIVVKAICDWADGLKDSRHQPHAVAVAVDLVHRVLSDGTALTGLARHSNPAPVIRSPRLRVNIPITNVPERVPRNAVERDLKTLRRLLRHLPLRPLSAFIDSAHIDRIPLEIFTYWEGFSAEMMSRDLQLFDEDLKRHLDNFHKAWGRALGHGEYFISTLAPHYRFRDWIIGEDQAIYDRRYAQYHADVTDTERSLDELVTFLKTNYPKIDLFEVGKNAVRAQSEQTKRIRKAMKLSKAPNAKASKGPRKTKRPASSKRK